MRETSSRSSIRRACTCALRSTFSSARSIDGDGHRVGAQQLGPAEDGVERRAQLVRERGQELVLQPVGFALAHQQLGALLLGAAPLGDFAPQLVVGPGELGLPRLDSLEHAVERVDQIAQLVVGRPRRPQRVVAAAGHLAGGAGERDERIGDDRLQARRQQHGDTEREHQQHARRSASCALPRRASTARSERSSTEPNRLPSCDSVARQLHGLRSEPGAFGQRPRRAHARLALLAVAGKEMRVALIQARDADVRLRRERVEGFPGSCRRRRTRERRGCSAGSDRPGRGDRARARRASGSSRSPGSRGWRGPPPPRRWS